MMTLGVVSMLIVSIELYGSGFVLTWIVLKELWETFRYRMDTTPYWEWLIILIFLIFGLVMIWGGYMIFPYTFTLATGLSV